MADDARNAEQVADRIRQMNEQILDTGRTAGLGFLDAYEQLLQAFLDSMQKSADASNVEWLAKMARAQADFTRDVMSAFTSAAREALNPK